MSDQLALLPGYLTAHLQLTLLALLLGTAISIPAGILAARQRLLEQPILAVASIIQTIPSLAFLAVMVPLLAALDLRSIGFLPAFIGLVLYSVLPILRNTVTGLTHIDPALVEAARGVGMTPGQRLLRVELPLALPVILAGLRTATVWTVGVATLSTPVGATSLGNYIFSGLQTRNLTAVLVGCVAAAVLALVLDALVKGLGTALEVGRRGWAITSAAVFALLYAYVGVTCVQGHAMRQEAPIVIGAKTFTEQYILSHVLADQIERATGDSVKVVSSLGSTVAFDALRANEIDAYVDYSGTLWTTILHRQALPGNRDQVIDEVRRFLAQKYGIQLVGALGFENTYALAVRGDQARKQHLRDIGDLTPLAPRMSIGGDYEFFARPEWKAIKAGYSLAFREERSMDSSLMYQAVAAGDVDVISAFSTDGRIATFDLAVLGDNKGVIPPYDAVVLAGPRLSREHQDVVDALSELSGTIDADHMQKMNLAVDEGGKSPTAVAQAFLRDVPVDAH